MHGCLSRPPFLWSFPHACHCCKCPYCKQESAKLWCSLLPTGRVNSFSHLVISQTQVICLINKFDLANTGATQGVIKFYCKQNTFHLPLIVRTITGFLLMTGGVNPERVLRRPLAMLGWQGWTMVQATRTYGACSVFFLDACPRKGIVWRNHLLHLLSEWWILCYISGYNKMFILFFFKIYRSTQGM